MDSSLMGYGPSFISGGCTLSGTIFSISEIIQQFFTGSLLIDLSKDTDSMEYD
jgi:hypothetical protein